MARYFFKHPLFIVILGVMFCFIAACNEKRIMPTNTNYGTGGDTSAVDSVASFNAPTGIALDATGNIYIADYGNNLIRKISTAGIVSTVAGNGNQGSLNGQGSLSSFNGPTGLVLDASGNIYVADAGNNQIRKITPSGMVSTFAGSDSVGDADGADTAATFFGPTGIASDASGNLYVADAGNNLIRMITPQALVTTLAGSTNEGATNGTLLNASFNNPTGIAVGAGGNLYVADMLNNLVREVDIGSGMVSTFAGSDTTASINGMGTAAGFYFPNSIAVDPSGNLYATEYVTDLIREITPAAVVTTFAGSGAQGQADSTGIAASFNGPSGVATDAAGNVYVADTYNNVIRKITPAGVVSTIAGSGLTGSTNGQALAVKHEKLAVAALRRAHKMSKYDIFKIFVKRRNVREPVYLRRK
jgi:sugar lactone lactonase YvrE